MVTRAEFRLHPLEQVVGGRFVYSGVGVREALLRYRDVVARSPRDLSCQVSLGMDQVIGTNLEIFPCYTGSDADPEELRMLRSAPGLVEDSVRTQTFLEQQRLINSAMARIGITGKVTLYANSRMSCSTICSDVSPRLGRPPGGIMIESLHGAPKDAECASRSGWLPPCGIQRQCAGSLAGPGPGC